jgi:hypothetical protein
LPDRRASRGSRIPALEPVPLGGMPRRPGRRS